MDAHVFRLLAAELATFLHGGRVEKIHSPAPGVFTMRVFSHGQKKFLVLRHSKVYNHGLQRVTSLKQDKEPPALYLSECALPNPQKPSTLVMTLRKHVLNRRLGASHVDWLGRRIFLALPQSKITDAPLWLCLDLVSGPSLSPALPDIPKAQWPDATMLKELLQPEKQEKLWRSFNTLTPILRKTLNATISEQTRRSEGLQEAAALLADIEYEAENNSGELNLYSFAGQAHLLSAWPLPDSLTDSLTKIPLSASLPRTPGAVVNVAAYNDRLLDKLPAAGTFMNNDILADSPTALAGFSFPLLEAARMVYEPQVLASLGANANKDESQQYNAVIRRLEKTLKKLEQEETRLQKMQAMRANAILLQGELWRFAADARMDSCEVALPYLPDASEAFTEQENNFTSQQAENEISDAATFYANGAHTYSYASNASEKNNTSTTNNVADSSYTADAPHSPTRCIILDPLLTLRENMQNMFHQSDRGIRGLKILQDRRKMMQAELNALKTGLYPQAAACSNTTGANSLPQARTNAKTATPSSQQRTAPDKHNTTNKTNKSGTLRTADLKKNKAIPAAKAVHGSKETLYRMLQSFNSSDGFLMLRGRSAQGNHALLKVASPHDIWLHVQDGPSAHVIIRRASLAVDVPESTMLEAGTLSAVKSWRKQDDRAEVMFALVKDVKPVKGGAAGSVLVSKTLGSFMVALNNETRLLEATLRLLEE